MLPLPATRPLWVATEGDFSNMLTRITAEPVIAVDTESNSLFAYKERVCLIQVSTPNADYLLDTLAITDISGLAPVFANPAQLKLFHAAEYDIICLKRDFGFTFKNIFDTMIAARILGEEQVGLGSLLATRFGVELDKRYQRANWGKRPLSEVMLDYARMDTHYLFALKSALENELIERNLWRLASEDFDLVCDVHANPAEANGNSCWKVMGGARISPAQSAVLQSLCRYRDQQAQKLDLPHFKVMSNQLLLELSQSTPGTLTELKLVPGMGDRLLHRHGQALLGTIKTGLEEKPPQRQPRSKPDKAYMDRLDALRDWRKAKGKELKVESDVILPREIMEQIAQAHPKQTIDLKNTMRKTPWRYRQYGREIMNILKKLEGHENPL